ncbi:CopG family transcriptional regulator [Kribbella monticola]|uniref:CopG family transcriptional regulator n=1 Tax=Kribbella monticola TaxID=2185285 RepID=UPI000DD41CD6|nr:CopG family transcriptional regulator [Kribbella monticola]
MGEPARTDKMSVTIPSDLAAELRQRAGRGNVSAYVTDALVRQLEHDRLGDLVTELAEVHGPVTEEELAAARAEWSDQ